jgi:hypothetical protein
MRIEPRVVGISALGRWIRQALELLWRGAGFWLALTLLMCLWMFMVHRTPILGGVLAVSSLLSCTLIAAQVDRSGSIRLGDVLEMLKVHARTLLSFASIVTLAGALIWLVLLARPEVAWWNIFYTERNAVEMLSGDWFVALRQIFVYSAFALGLCYFGLNIPGVTSFFQFPCMTLLALPYRAAWRLSGAGQIRNLAPMLGIGLLFVVLPVVAGLLLPPLVPVLYCFFGALIYVSFREIFLGIGENQAHGPTRVAAGSVSSPLSSRA